MITEEQILNHCYTDYELELKRKEAIDRSFNRTLTMFGVTGTILAYLANNVTSLSPGSPLTLFIIFAGTGLLAAAYAVSRYFRAHWGLTYEYFIQSSVLLEAYKSNLPPEPKGVLERVLPSQSGPSENLRKIKSEMLERIASAADINRGNNNRRATLLRNTNRGLMVALIALIISFVPHSYAQKKDDNSKATCYLQLQGKEIICTMAESENQKSSESSKSKPAQKPADPNQQSILPPNQQVNESTYKGGKKSYETDTGNVGDTSTDKTDNSGSDQSGSEEAKK